MMVKKLYILFFVFALCSQVSEGQGEVSFSEFTGKDGMTGTITKN